MRVFIKSVALLCAFCLLAGSFARPVSALTASEEEQMGKKFIQQVRRHLHVVDDPVVNDYVSSIGDRIVKVLPQQPFRYRFYVIQQEVYNAFAGPGGHVCINSGLITAMETEEELAGILAHEIAHVACRHIARRIEQSKRVQLATLAGMLAGIFLGAGAGQALGSAATVGSIAAGASLALAYSREDEIQADEIGLQLLSDVGYGAEGLLRMLKKIRSKQWFGREQIPTYMSTHPATEERMAYIDTWLQGHRDPREEEAAAAAYRFAKVRTRVTALYGDPEIAQRRYAQAVSEQPADSLAWFGYGMVLSRLLRNDESERAFQKALETQPFDEDILRELGQVYFQSGQYAKALQIIEAALSSDSGDPLSLLILGRTQLEMGRVEDAVKTLGNLVKARPDYAQGCYHLAQAAGRLGELSEAYFYLGRFHELGGDPAKAAFQYRKALKEAGNDRVKADKIQEALRNLPKPEPGQEP